MNLFRSYTFSWKQIGIFKLSLLCLGAAIGAYWSDFFMGKITILIIVGAVCGLYIWMVARKN